MARAARGKERERFATLCKQQMSMCGKPVWYDSNKNAKKNVNTLLEVKKK